MLRPALSPSKLRSLLCFSVRYDVTVKSLSVTETVQDAEDTIKFFTALSQPPAFRVWLHAVNCLYLCPP